MQPHRGTMVLVMGILAIVSGLGIIFGPIAWIMGNKDLKEMDAGRMDPEGRQQTQIGKILGMVATILSIVGLCIGCIVMVLMFGAFGLAVGTAIDKQKQRPIQNQPFPPVKHIAVPSF